MKVFVTGAAGFIGGSIATALVKAGHQVTGLVRSTDQEQEMLALGITPVLGSLDDSDLLAQQAGQADAVINAASSDHRGAVEALIKALRGTGKVFLHTSGSSIVGDASGGKASDVIYYEGQLPEPTVDKAARVAIDNLVLAAAHDNVRSAVICNTLIYGHSLGVKRDSVQPPRLLNRRVKAQSCAMWGRDKTSGPTCISKTLWRCTCWRWKRPRPGRSTLLKAAKRRFAT